MTTDPFTLPLPADVYTARNRLPLRLVRLGIRLMDAPGQATAAQWIRLGRQGLNDAWRAAHPRPHTPAADSLTSTGLSTAQETR